MAAWLALAGGAHAQRYRFVWSDGVASLFDTLPLMGDEAFVNSTVQRVDDGPYQRVNLSFAFPWFDELRHEVALSPNGELSLAPQGPCCVTFGNLTACAFSFFNCTFDTAYRDIIAGFLTDLNPAATPAARVRVASTPRGLTVAYAGVPLFFANLSDPRAAIAYEFSISIFPSGRIAVRYVSVREPAEIYGPSAASQAPPALVGLRHVSLSEEYARGPSGALNEFASEWRTTGPGLYVPRAQLRSNSTLQWFPSGARACAAGAGANATKLAPGLNATIYTAFAAVAASLADKLSYACVFAPAGGAPAAERVAAAWDAARQVFSCALPAWNVSSGLVNVTLEGASEHVGGAVVSEFGRGDAAATLELVAEAPAPASALALCERCGQALPPNSSVCPRDCGGFYFGTAQRDACGVCAGGATGVAPNATLDCEGACGGPFELRANMCVCAENGTAPGMSAGSRCFALTGALPGSAPHAPGFLLCLTPRYVAAPEPNATLAVGARVALELCGAPRAGDNDTRPATTQGWWVRVGGVRVAANYSCSDAGTLRFAAPPGPPNATARVRVGFVRADTGEDEELAGANALHLAYFDAGDPRLSQPLEPADAYCNDCGLLLRPDTCVRDCAGSWRGDAYIDACGTCVGGRTGRPDGAERDCAGFCRGRHQLFGSLCLCQQSNAANCTQLQRERDAARAQATLAPGVEADLRQLLALSRAGARALPGEEPLALPPQPGARVNARAQSAAAPALAAAALSAAASGANATALPSPRARPAPLPLGERVHLFDNLTVPWGAPSGEANVAFESLALPFTFRHLGAAVRRVAVSPRGAVYFAADAHTRVARALLPAGDVAGGEADPDYSHVDDAAAASFLNRTAFAGDEALVAGLLADWDLFMLLRAPSVRAAGASAEELARWPRVSALATREFVTIDFAGMRLLARNASALRAELGGDDRFAFRVSLFASGRYQVRWLRAADPRALSAGWWAAAPPRRAFVGAAPPRAAATYAPLVEPAAAPASNRTLELCALSRRWCVFPPNISTVGGTAVYVGGGADASCLAEQLAPSAAAALPLQLLCDFGGELRLATPDAARGGYVCEAPSGPQAATIFLALLFNASAPDALPAAPRPLDALTLAATPLTWAAPGDVPAASPQRLCSACATAFRDYCWTDCAGIFRGNATLNSCRSCANGFLPAVEPDCRGVCGGRARVQSVGEPAREECVCQVQSPAGATMYPRRSLGPLGLPLPGNFQACWFNSVAAGPERAASVLHALWQPLLAVAVAAAALAVAAAAAAALVAAGARRGDTLQPPAPAVAQPILAPPAPQQEPPPPPPREAHAEEGEAESDGDSELLQEEPAR